MSNAEFIAPTNGDPVLKIPSDWQERVPEGWEWQSLWEAVEVGDHIYTDEFVRKAIDAEIDPRVILDDGLFPGFDLQGDRFSAQVIFIPDKVKILIGGAPTTQEWADECGADGWGRDAVQAVKLALEKVKEPRAAWN